MRKLIPLLMVLCAAPAYAQLLKWTDSSGKVHYSERPQDSANAKEPAAQRPVQPAATEVNDWHQRERESRDRRLQREAANQEAADAVVREPAYNPRAQSQRRR